MKIKSRTKLLLVRHGATSENTARPYRIQGALPDNELNAVGLAQVHAASGALSHHSIAGIYCSPLKRARTSANIIATTLSVPVEVVEGLVEVDVGLWSGLSWEEIEQQWPAEYRNFHENAGDNCYLGGENLTQLRDRTLPVIDRLVARHPAETLVIVGHGVINRVLLAHWLGIPLRHARRLPQDNAAITSIEFQDGLAKVITINATAHLADLGFQTNGSGAIKSCA